MIIERVNQILNTPISISPRKTEGHSSNPFAATSFKGNVLTADVFETKQNKPSMKDKLKLSAFVGSIGDAFPTFRKGLESVIAFGGRMKEGFSSAINKLNEIGNTHIDLAAPGRAIKAKFVSFVDKNSVNSLYNKYDEAALGQMLSDELSMNIIG